MNTLYVTDLDGTFLNSKGELSSNTKEMLSDALSKGTGFTLATARTFATVTQMFDGVDLKLPVILMNGVMVYDLSEKAPVSCHSIDTDSTKKVFETYRKHNVYPLVYRYKKPYLEIEYYDRSNPYQMQYISNRNEANGKKFIYSPAFTCEGKDDVIYIVTLDMYERLLPLYNNIKIINDISCVFYRDNYTDCYFLEIFAKDVSKASALLEVKRMAGAEKVIAFGDNLNDMEMFKASDEAYAVGNACDELKSIATGVIGNNDDDSVARYILEHFMENKL